MGNDGHLLVLRKDTGWGLQIYFNIVGLVNKRVRIKKYFLGI